MATKCMFSTGAVQIGFPERSSRDQARRGTSARSFVRSVLLAAAVGSVTGCGAQSAETKRQLDIFNERLVTLQNDRDRLVERVDALESQLGRAPTNPERVAEEGGETARPLLKVVRLEPPHSPREEGAEEVSEGAATAPERTETGALAGGAEPQVVLYGEGVNSGVRSAGEGATKP